MKKMTDYGCGCRPDNTDKDKGKKAGRTLRHMPPVLRAAAGGAALLILAAFLAGAEVLSVQVSAAETGTDTKKETASEAAEAETGKNPEEISDESAEDRSEEKTDESAEEVPEESLEKAPGAQYVEIDPAAAVIGSEYAVLMSGDDGTLVAGRNAFEPMYPASMTKIMTVLVAAENIRSLSETAIVTQKNIDYAIAHDCTTVGFKASEQPTMADLLYGTILISGADAALTLAEHVAGSTDAFVDLMNEKAESLGLKATHFTNPIGLFAEDNVSTAQEVAVILAAAVRNPLVHKILSTQQYTTSSTRQHPDGITVTNMFLLRSGRLEDAPPVPEADEAVNATSEGISNGTSNGTSESQTSEGEETDQAAAENVSEEPQILTAVPGLILSAKTGYVNQSRYCAASLFITEDGRKYICVTGKTDTAMHCVEDHRAMYSRYIPALDEAQ